MHVAIMAVGCYLSVGLLLAAVVEASVDSHYDPGWLGRVQPVVAVAAMTVLWGPITVALAIMILREMRDVPVKSSSVRTTMKRLVEEAERRAAAGENQ
jgi:hypothetical protein